MEAWGLRQGQGRKKVHQEKRRGEEVWVRQGEEEWGRQGEEVHLQRDVEGLGAVAGLSQHSPPPLLSPLASGPRLLLLLPLLVHSPPQRVRWERTVHHLVREERRRRRQGVGRRRDQRDAWAEREDGRGGRFRVRGVWVLVTLARHPPAPSLWACRRHQGKGAARIKDIMTSVATLTEERLDQQNTENASLLKILRWQRLRRHAITNHFQRNVRTEQLQEIGEGVTDTP